MNRSIDEALSAVQGLMEAAAKRTPALSQDASQGKAQKAGPYFSPAALSAALSYAEDADDCFIVLTRIHPPSRVDFMPHELLYEMANDALIANTLLTIEKRPDNPEWLPDIRLHYVANMGLRAAYLSGFISASRESIRKHIMERSRRGDRQAVEDAKRVDDKYVRVIQANLNKVLPLVSDADARAAFIRRVDVPVLPAVVGIRKDSQCCEVNGVWMDGAMSESQAKWLNRQAQAMSGSQVQWLRDQQARPKS